jgi:hypothetical protein
MLTRFLVESIHDSIKFILVQAPIDLLANFIAFSSPKPIIPGDIVDLRLGRPNSHCRTLLDNRNGTQMRPTVMVSP